jgi:hypothetical protein
METRYTESAESESRESGGRRELTAALRDAAREVGDTVACAIHDSSTKLAEALRELLVQSRGSQSERTPSINAVYARKHGGRPMSEKTKEEVDSLERMRARKKPGSER